MLLLHFNKTDPTLSLLPQPSDDATDSQNISRVWFVYFPKENHVWCLCRSNITESSFFLKKDNRWLWFYHSIPKLQQPRLFTECLPQNSKKYLVVLLLQTSKMAAVIKFRNNARLLGSRSHAEEQQKSTTGMRELKDGDAKNPRVPLWS